MTITEPCREILLDKRDCTDPDRREEWIRWFTRHGIDPTDIAVPGWLICEDGPLDRCIWITALHRVGAGPMHMAWCCPDGDRSGMAYCVVRRKVQLEGPALPFPFPSTTERKTP